MSPEIRIEREVSEGKLLVVGLTDDNRVAFNISLRKWATTSAWVGTNIGEMIEIDWLEIKPEFRSIKMLFVALCEALTSAVFLAGDTVMVFGVTTENDRLERALKRRSEFERIEELPLPFVTTAPGVAHLTTLVCR